MRKVRVELGKDSYDIIIGFGLNAEMEAFIRHEGFSSKAVIVSDSNVGKLYGEEVREALVRAGLDAELCIIPAGEPSKTLAEAEKLYTRAIEKGLDRKSPIFALGGGVVGDLAGFVAATYMRGVPFIQLPTSLLAQVDSSVGGKVAVNHALGKNLIGAFYQPKAVFMDLNFMKSLPQREIFTGLGEVVKYGIIYDEDFFDFLEGHRDSVLSLEAETLLHIIARSCEIKALVVSQDEKESGLRRILNFGHTMAHAIEEETCYSRYNHGEAVAIGMMGAAYISESIGHISGDVTERVRKLLLSMKLPVQAEGCTVEHMYQSIFRDKKTLNGRVNWVLMKRIGETCVDDNVPEDVVREAMRKCIR
ncbi:MAG: 3-dehydroquinate synthase [Selenomonadaceae bacterium]|nr:3-dehydroquinate synthase [Selenomonadaceae bacterium]